LYYIRGRRNYYSRSPLFFASYDIGVSILFGSRGDSQERRKLLLSFSPLFLFEAIIYLFYCVLHVGEIHRVALEYNSRSPLSDSLFMSVVVFYNLHVGENTQKRRKLNSRSPPMNRKIDDF